MIILAMESHEMEMESPVSSYKPDPQDALMKGEPGLPWAGTLQFYSKSMQYISTATLLNNCT